MKYNKASRERGGGYSLHEWESAEWSVFSSNLDTDSIWDDLSSLLKSVVVSLDELGESVLSGDEDLLSSWELELGSPESLLSVVNILWVGSHGKEDLTNVNSCGLAKSLTEGTSHTLLEPICTSAGKHLVDTNHMPWMDSGSHVEVLLTNIDGHVLVASNTSGLKSFGGDLLLLVANHMDAGGESVMSGLLLSDVIDSKFGVWHTTIESGFWIWFILLVPIA